MKNIITSAFSLLVDTLATLGFFVAFMAALVSPLWIGAVFPELPSWAFWSTVLSMGPILAILTPE